MLLRTPAPVMAMFPCNRSAKIPWWTAADYGLDDLVELVVGQRHVAEIRDGRFPTDDLREHLIELEALRTAHGLEYDADKLLPGICVGDVVDLQSGLSSRESTLPSMESLAERLCKAAFCTAGAASRTFQSFVHEWLALQQLRVCYLQLLLTRCTAPT